MKTSKGTYIRTPYVAGVGAHLTFLRRIDRPGVELRHIGAASGCRTSGAERLGCLEPPESLLCATRVTLDGDNAARFLSGVVSP